MDSLFAGSGGGSFAGEDSEVLNELAQAPKENSALENVATVAFAPAGVVLGAIDTVGQSVGLLDENDLQRGLSRLHSGAGQLYKDNRTGFRFAGDIATTFVGAGVATKVLRANSLIKRLDTAIEGGSKSAKLFKNIVVSDTGRIDEDLKTLTKQALILGKKGVRNPLADPEYRKVKNGLRLKQFTNDLKEGVAAEAFIMTAQSESELFFPEGQSIVDLAIGSIGGLGIGNAIGQAIITPALKKAATLGGKAASERGDEFGLNAAHNFLIADGRQQEFAQGINADEVTGLVNASPERRAFFNDIKSEDIRQKIEATTALKEATPIEGISKSIKGTPDSGEIAQLEDISRNHPRLFSNVISVEDAEFTDDFFKNSAKQSDKLKTEKTDLLNNRNNLRNTDRTIADNRLDDINEQLRRLNESTVVSLNRLGLITPDRKARTVFDERNIKTTTIKREVVGDTFGKDIFMHNAQNGNKIQLGTAIDGSIYSQAGKNVKQINSTFGFDDYTSSGVYATHPKALKRLGEVLENKDDLVPQPKVATKIHKNNASYQQLDFITNALKIYGRGTDFNSIAKVVDLSDFKDVNDIKFTALQLKRERFSRIISREAENTRNGNDAGNLTQNIATELMLPLSNDGGSSSYVLEWFTDLHKTGKSIGDDYDKAVTALTQHFSFDAGDRTAQALRVDNGLNFSNLIEVDYVNKLNKNHKPLSLVIDSNADTSGNIDAFNLINAAKVAEQRRLINLSSSIKKDQYGSEVLVALDELATEQADRVAEIRQGLMQLNQGSGNNPLFPKIGNLSPTQEIHKNRGVSGIHSADGFSDSTSRLTNAIGNSYVNNNMKGLTKVLKPGNEDSAFEVQLYIGAYEQGWELLNDIPDELGRFKLDPNSARNKKMVADSDKLVQEKFNGIVPEFLPNIAHDVNTPLRVGTDAAEALEDLFQVSRIRWSTANTLARNLDNTGMVKRVGHIPTPRGYHNRVFITDNNGRNVQHVDGTSMKDAANKAKTIIDNLNAQDKLAGRSGGYGIVDRSNIEAYKTANHHVVTSAALRTGSGEAAKAAPTRQAFVSDINYLSDMLSETKAIFSDIGKDYTKTLFAKELENTKSLQRVANVDNKGLTNLFTGDQADSFPDVFTSFTNILTGDNQRNLGSLYGSFGSIIDETFGTTFAGARDAWTKAMPSSVNRDSINKAAIKYAEKNNHNPIEFAASAGARAVEKGKGYTGDKLVRQLAGLTTGLALKWGEVGHATLTLASILTTTPHAIRYAGKLAGESDSDYFIRVGHTHDMLDNANALPNPVKLTMTTMMKRMKGDYKEVLKDAALRGFTDAKLSEFIDEIAVKRGGKISQILEKADNALGYVSTKSEDWARETAFLTAYEMFKTTGKNSHEVSMAMANTYANRAIADYRPHQRAELFKGTSGVPLAMFQTFAINYFQRLGSAIENKAYGAAFTQAGTQAMMFGAQSVPGWEVFNEALLENWNETQRPEDLLREGFKNENFGRLLLYGTPTALPMLLGADNGVALHTRGEMSLPRNITPATIFNTPFFNFAGKSASALKRGFETAGSSPSVGGKEALRESLIHAIPSRPLRGLLDVTIQGYSTNANGDIINDELDTIFNQAVHIAGLKRVTDAEKSVGLFRDSQRQFSERAAMRRLSDAFTAKIRDVGVDGLTGKDIENISTQYLANNGSSSAFKSWAKRKILKAELSKADRAIIKSLNSTKEGRDLKHFLGVDEDSS